MEDRKRQADSIRGQNTPATRHGKTRVSGVTKPHLANPGSGAFTLVELMVVVTILGILASITSIKVVQYLKRARIVKAHTDMKRIMAALELFNMDNHEYPESLDELTEGTTDEHPEGILTAIPKDPWGGDYEYVGNTEEHGYELTCWGRDGTEGGEGEDADIESWNMDQAEGEEGATGE